MKIAIYGKSLGNSFKDGLKKLYADFIKNNIEVYFFLPFYYYIENQYKINFPKISFFSSSDDLPDDITVILSIGGDGTFLETITIIKDKDIPVLGINTGRLGFLATVNQNNITNLVKDLYKGNFETEKRTLLKLNTKGIFDDFNYALNDITIQKAGSGLITIHTYLNNDYLNSYWADGLIIATPTGSTAYSLSVGGPVVLPNSGNFIISPIAPHTLTVRPVVVPDDMEITLKVESRENDYLLSLDHKSKLLHKTIDIKVVKSDYNIKIIKLLHFSYYEVLRNKLMWGLDKRN